MESLRKRFPAIRLITLLVVASFLNQPSNSQQESRPGAPAIGEQPAVKNIFWQPDEVKQGSPVLISVELNGPARAVNATWLGKQFRFARSEKPHVWVALAGADVDQKPGSFELRVRASMGEHVVRLAKQIEVKEAQFGTGDVNVAEDYVTPTQDEQRQIAHNELEKKDTLSRLTPHRLWKGDFLRPVDAEPTPSFGETRVMNEEKASRHLGTDYPTREGTPVFASNAGVVALAAPLFYEGNCVIIDHGERLFTVYMHLEKMRVHRGELVRKHAEIGLSGRTGRVTGPHMHFEIVWNGDHLDPVQLLALTLPDREMQTTRARGQ